MSACNILLVDDEPSMCRYLQTLLEADSYQVETASNGFQALERVQRSPLPDLVLLDLLMPDLDGLETLERLRQCRPALKVVMLSCVSEPCKVVQAMRLGAVDYLAKPFQKAELDAVLNHRTRPQSALTELETQAFEVEELGENLSFVAAGPAMHKIRLQAAQIANTDVPVLLLGETWTGKELVARLIHKMSSRSHRAFLKVNCAALPGELLESELFGYEAGAFTGAVRAKPGKFELCNKGTILLDEIGEMHPGLQAKLLHVLQDQEFARLGGRSTIKVDVRVLAATNINIQQAIASRRLREDLYYRLNAFTFHLPPLRERQEEIPFLLRHMMAGAASRYARTPLPLSGALVEACLRNPWPGNLRELENSVKRYVVLGDEALVLSELEPRAEPSKAPSEAVKNTAREASGDLKSLLRGLKNEVEMEAIARALAEANGVRKETARLLNISTKALLYKIRQYGLDQR